MKPKAKNGVLFVVQAGVIAAAYAALTYFSGLFGLAYGPVQFRLSEALTVLPIFTPAAIPGLAVGCLIGNIGSQYFVLDMIFGTTASLLAAIATRRLRNICFKGQPILSLLPPVLFNAVIVGLEITLFTPGEAATLTGFLGAALSVGFGQLAVCYGLGLPLAALVKRTEIFK